MANDRVKNKSYLIFTLKNPKDQQKYKFNIKVTKNHTWVKQENIQYNKIYNNYMW